MEIIPERAATALVTWSYESNSGSLSSCKSRLYAKGRPLSVESSPVRLPIKRPAFPRASSAMSAFFFCGSMDEPVANRSSSVAKPNSSVVHSTHSSPSLERCVPIKAKSNSASATKSRSETASSELPKAVANPISRAVKFGSNGRDEPASAPAPNGETSARSTVSSKRSMSLAKAHA